MTVKATQEVHIRANEPWIKSGNKKGILYPGFEVEVINVINTNAQVINGNGTWYQDKNGDYLWSGGFSQINELGISNRLYQDSNFWWHRDYHLHELWGQGLTGKGIKVGILDSGIDLPHTDLIISTNQLFDCTQSGNINDYTGHGTHVSGIIKSTSNGFGTKGIAFDADFFFMKITDDVDGDQPQYMANAIRKAIDLDLDIISISNGVEKLNTDIRKAIEEAAAKSILVICAAGNRTGASGSDVLYPAKFDSTISIGGCTESQEPLSDSINTNYTELFAPGKDILSTYPNNAYRALSGSSQATPFVAGIACLLLQRARQLNADFKSDQLKQMLIDSSDSSVQNIKIINPLLALEMINS
ncbi:S8 family peptidase [Roseivirga sp.]|uniref:S8 family peptidase n=1 Tax=Roseivirga sp. TaxID=1964215 RepID=UPI002B26D630|nr:S8 family serine peptidase [Roseivirga sp.]